MRSDRIRNWKPPLLATLLGLALLMVWVPARRPQSESAMTKVEPGNGEGTSTPAAASMLLHLLGWGTGGIAIVAMLFIGSRVWMADQEADAVARALTGGNPARASMLATRYGCGGCHTIPGLPGAEGQVGPPLEGLRQRVFIAGVLPNTADNLINWIVQPRRYSPRSAMPVTGIDAEGARDIAAYLYAH